MMNCSNYNIILLANALLMSGHHRWQHELALGELQPDRQSWHLLEILVTEAKYLCGM
jgi:hypothetical protein